MIDYLLTNRAAAPLLISIPSQIPQSLSRHCPFIDLTLFIHSSVLSIIRDLRCEEILKHAEVVDREFDDEWLLLMQTETGRVRDA